MCLPAYILLFAAISFKVMLTQDLVSQSFQQAVDSSVSALVNFNGQHGIPLWSIKWMIDDGTTNVSCRLMYYLYSTTHVHAQKLMILIYQGYSKSNAPNFIMYEQITIVACIIHQKKGTRVRIKFLLLHVVSISLKSYSPSMNEGMYTSVVELSRLMSKPIQDSSFHFIVTAMSVAPESFCHWTKEVAA